MQKTLHIDENTLREARLACGVSADETLIRQVASQRLRKLRGSENSASDVKKKRTGPHEAQRQGCLMVLVDTSVWMRFLANRPPFAAELDRLLDHGEKPDTLSYTANC